MLCYTWSQVCTLLNSQQSCQHLTWSTAYYPSWGESLTVKFLLETSMYDACIVGIHCTCICMHVCVLWLLSYSLLLDGGVVYSWGNNEYGQLGVPVKDTQVAYQFMQSLLERFVNIIMGVLIGKNHTCCVALQIIFRPPSCLYLVVLHVHVWNFKLLAWLL